MKKSCKLNLYGHVDVYTELRDLFEENEPEFLEGLTEDEQIGIDHALDFEDFSFLVVNYKTVIVIHDGDVISIQSMKEFKSDTKEFINEE